MKQPHVDNTQRRARLAHRHRLTPSTRSDDPCSIASDLVALHSSDPATVYLSVAARMNHPTIEPTELALYTDRTLIRHHAMRRTLWVVTSDMIPVLHAACTRTIAISETKRTLALLGQSPQITNPEDWLGQATEQVVELVKQRGPIVTREIGRLLPDLALKVTVSQGSRNEATIAAHTRVLLLAGLAGRLFRGRPVGTWISSQYAWTTGEAASVDDIEQLEETEAIARLVRRWLERFGPGTLRDITWWSGLKVTAVREALEALGAVTVGLDGSEPGFLLPVDLEESVEPAPWVALLPGLDPSPMGWKDRHWYLDEVASHRTFDRNGNVGPTIWADGIIVGGWAQTPAGEIATELYRPLDRNQTKLLDAEVERVKSVIGDVRFRVRFPSRNQAELLAQAHG